MLKGENVAGYIGEIRYQFVSQGESPDHFTQFLWRITALDQARKNERARELEMPEPEYANSCALLTSVMFAGMEINGELMKDFRKILKNIFQDALGTLIISRIDWGLLLEKRKAIEAVARSL